MSIVNGNSVYGETIGTLAKTTIFLRHKNGQNSTRTDRGKGVPSFDEMVIVV